ncbi:MAG: UxaA family hydrolase [Deltaproteobacteria bacterium]|nr:UxaA family hydrolase [Deltaproteobacteria bacterium]
MKVDSIVIKEKDNVATALRDLAPKEKITLGIEERRKGFIVEEPVPFGHKFAVKAIVKGEYILKYGEVIGRATKDIAPGSHAHIHNIESLRGRGDLR